MWEHRASLLVGLKEHNIAQANETTKDEYQKLLLHNQPWWALLRLLKTSKLEAGLGLTVPKVFEEHNTTPVIKKGIRTPGLQTLAASSQVQGSSSNRVSGPGRGGRVNIEGNGSTQEANKTTRDPVIQAPPPSPTGEPHIGSDEHQPALFPADSDLGLERPQKKQKILEQDDNGHDSDFYRPLTPLGSDGDAEVLDSIRPQHLRCHSKLSQQLHHLESRVSDLRPDEARALNSLLEAIVDLQGTSNMVRVVETLNSKIQVCVYL